jgi:predicted PurR-regulated permease PerM
MPSIKLNDGVSVLIKHKWKIVLAVIIFLIASMFVYIILPLLDGIIMGVVLAYVARPVKKYIDKYAPKASPYIAIGIIVIPVFLIIGFGIVEIFNNFLWAMKNQDYVTTSLLNLTEKLNLPEFARVRVNDVILNFTSYLLPLLKQLPLIEMVKIFSMFIINIFLAVLLGFYLLLDGGRLVEEMMEMIPLEVEDFSRRFIRHFDNILSAMFIGNTYSAIAIGVLSLFVFWAFGFTNVLALSALMLIAAIVPMLTTWMVVIVMAIYRYFEKGSESALIFFAVALFVVIIPPELLIRPYIINTKSNIHPMLIIIAFLGGGLVGGVAGFFIAPILLGAIVAAYRAEGEVKRNGIMKRSFP